MKGIIGLGVFAIFYLIIIHLCQVSTAQLFNFLGNGLDSKNNGVSGTVNPNGFSTPSLQTKAGSDPAAILEKWGITDPTVISNINNVYGSLLGQPECVQKSICVMGNYFHELPGRDVVFTLLGRYIPPEWGLLYDIFRVSVMYGQDCEAYRCDPERAASVAQQRSSTLPPITVAPSLSTVPMNAEQFEANNQIQKGKRPGFAW